jgi:diguanylate cyclase (GGDEF)-like protein/PAS domain S-box-containing protein
MNSLNSTLLESIIEHTQIGIALCNVDTNRLEMINSTYASICGCDKSAINTCQCVFYSTECNGNKDDLMCSLYNSPIEMELTKKDGAIIPIETYVSRFKDSDGTDYRLINVVDISKRKRFESMMLERKESYRALVEFSPDLIARYDREAHLLYTNPALSELLGRPTEEVIGATPSDLIHSPSSLGYEAAIRRCFDTVIPEDFEYAFTDSSTGKNVVHMIRLVPELISETGIPKYVIGIGRDITSLIDQKHCLEEAQGIAQVGNWELKYPTKLVECSNEMFHIFEIAPQNSPDFQIFLSYIHPDDRELVSDSMRYSILNKTPFDIVHRLLLNDEKVKYLHHRGETFYDNEGNSLRTVGTTQDITKQKVNEAKIEYMAFHDPLTELPNRLMAKKQIDHMLYTSLASSKIAILFIDLDGFKLINDTLGHTIGDMVLKSVASKFHRVLCSSDIVYRLGGDEFILVLPNIVNEEDVEKIIKKIFDEFHIPCQVIDHSFTVRMSIGISLYPDHADSFETLLQKADMAMYKIKENGKNGYRFYHEELSQYHVGQFEVLNDLKVALNEKQFILYYQPQIDLLTNSIIGVEALIRWKHPILGIVPPTQFISIAEHNGLIVSIGEWVIREACRQAKIWLSQGDPLTVAVNISSLQFKRGNLKDIVINALNEFNIPPHMLELELTESIMMNDHEETLKEVAMIKSIGVKLSIDDFGTGYSSLAYLKRFAVDKLKIDQSFIRGILKDHEDAAIVHAIIQMSKSLGLKTIAEGVECAEVLDVLSDQGCDEVQGYHFAKPMNPLEFEKYYLGFGQAQ